MRDRELYAKLLGIEAPWRVVEVGLEEADHRVEVFLEHDRSAPLRCPTCGRVVSGYDARERRWRHLDTMQYQTVLVAKVPRVKCPTDGIKQIKVPWAEPGSRFTAMFEALAIDWLKEASISAVARHLGLSWDEADGIMQRAVRRGLARRGKVLPTHIGVDEKSFQKRHQYVTLVVDQEHSTVVHVTDDRRAESLARFYGEYSPEELAQIKTISMDMWDPFIKATRDHVPGADDKIAFDRFHVIQHMTHAVDLVRRKEHKALRREGDMALARTRYLWLKNLEDLPAQQRDAFDSLRNNARKTARAWALKELGRHLWHYRRRSSATKAWKRWYGWALRSRLQPMETVGRTVRRHLRGIVNAVIHNATNARTEGLNSSIQWLKYTARGYRNRDRFRDAIYFHLGGLDLYPASLPTR